MVCWMVCWLMPWQVVWLWMWLEASVAVRQAKHNTLMFDSLISS